MADTELLLNYIIGGLIILGLFFMMILQRQETRRLAATLDGTLRMLNISSKKGEAGENLMYEVAKPLIQAGILEKDVHLPDGLEMDFAAVLDYSETGGRIYVPIDSKVNKKPIKVIEEISKYIGKSYGNGVRTTSFAIVGYPNEEEQNYMEKRAKAREQSVFFVKVSELPVYINFIRWYHDNIAPLESAGPEIARALIIFKNHYAEVEKQVNAVQQKMIKLVDTVKFSPIGENLRKTLDLVEPASEETQSVEILEPSEDNEATTEEVIQITFALSDDLPLADFVVKGMGQKRKFLDDSAYETVGQIRVLSMYDLTEMGFTKARAEKIYTELNREKDTS